jgi:hypothetical protein
MFVQNRGNLSDLEKSLGISYPTIRGKLDEIIKIISAASLPSAHSSRELDRHAPSATGVARDSRREILNQVAGGRLSPADALIALRGEEKDLG